MSEQQKSAGMIASAAASVGLIVGFSAGGTGVSGSAFRAPDGAELVRAELRFHGDAVGVFHCYRIETSPGLFSQGCPDAALIDFQKSTPSASDIRKAFVALHSVKK